MRILLEISIGHFVPMKETSNSIFDEQFLASVSPRRLNIMPLLLKLYVGFYTVSWRDKALSGREIKARKAEAAKS